MMCHLPKGNTRRVGGGVKGVFFGRRTIDGGVSLGANLPC